MQTLYYTWEEKNTPHSYHGCFSFVIYSRSRKQLIEYLDKKFEEKGWGNWRGRGTIIREGKPGWYKYKNILGA